MYKSLKSRLENELKEIQKSGRFKKEREILTKQNSLIKTTKSEVINFCANNYLGLASNEKIIQAAKKQLMIMVLDLPQLDLYVELKIFIRN